MFFIKVPVVLSDYHTSSYVGLVGSTPYFYLGGGAFYYLSDHFKIRLNLVRVYTVIYLFSIDWVCIYSKITFNIVLCDS